MPTWNPTHVITFTPDGGTPEVTLVALDPDREGDGPAYTRAEWDADAHTDWSRTGGEWRWRNECAPGPGDVEVHALTLDISYPDGSDRLPLYWRRTGECEPATPARLVLCPEAEPPTLCLEPGRYHGDGTPTLEWHRRIIVWAVTPYLAPSDCHALLDAVAPLAERVCAGYSCEWDGHNHVGRLTDDADAADSEIERLCDRVKADETVAVWDPVDWIAGCSVADLLQGESVSVATKLLATEAERNGVYFDGDLEQALQDRIDAEKVED